MSNDPINKVIFIGQELIDRADKLQELGRAIPDLSRKLRGQGEFLVYAAGEYNRLASEGIDLSRSPELGSIDEVEKTLSWCVTSVSDVATTTTTVSGASTSITEPILPYVQEKPEMKLLADPPKAFQELKATEELVKILNEAKPDLGNTWKNAWNQLAMGDASSVKSAAANARTVIDELSWKTSYQHISQLEWCKLDDDGKPTRATRFAWILHGDNLPKELKNDPSQDPLWKTLSQNYEKLNKYVHISTIQQGETTYLKTILAAIQECLERYLHQGTKRLK